MLMLKPKDADAGAPIEMEIDKLSFQSCETPDSIDVTKNESAALKVLITMPSRETFSIFFREYILLK